MSIKFCNFKKCPSRNECIDDEEENCCYPACIVLEQDLEDVDENPCRECDLYNSCLEEYNRFYSTYRKHLHHFIRIGGLTKDDVGRTAFFCHRINEVIYIISGCDKKESIKCDCPLIENRRIYQRWYRSGGAILIKNAHDSVPSV
jgi:hypothetical protein